VTKTQSAGPISYLEHRATRVLHCAIVTRAAVLMFPLLLQRIISNQMRPRRLRVAWFSRLLRHPARRWSGSISPGTHTGDDELDHDIRGWESITADGGTAEPEDVGAVTTQQNHSVNFTTQTRQVVLQHNKITNLRLTSKPTCDKNSFTPVTERKSSALFQLQYAILQISLSMNTPVTERRWQAKWKNG